MRALARLFLKAEGVPSFSTLLKKSQLSRSLSKTRTLFSESKSNCCATNQLKYHLCSQELLASQPHPRSIIPVVYSQRYFNKYIRMVEQRLGGGIITAWLFKRDACICTRLYFFCFKIHLKLGMCRRYTLSLRMRVQ